MCDSALIKVTKVEAVGGHRLRLRFSDGCFGERDFAEIFAADGPMLAPLRDVAYFARVFVECGAPTWPNGYDLAPNALYAELAELGLLRRIAAV
jgi:hypothetical protein